MTHDNTSIRQILRQIAADSDDNQIKAAMQLVTDKDIDAAINAVNPDAAPDDAEYQAGRDAAKNYHPAN